MAPLKRISQENFDNMVRENVDEFGMELEEAIEDVIDQLKGYDLSNVITKPIDEDHVIISLINTLRECGEDEEVIKTLQALTEECNKNSDSRNIAAARGALSLVIGLCSSSENVDLVRATLSTIMSLLTKNRDQRDLFARDGVSVLVELFSRFPKNTELNTMIFRTAKTASIKHEMGKAKIVEAGIENHIAAALENGSGLEIREACSVIRAVTLADDETCQMSAAHERVKQLVKFGMLDKLLKALHANHSKGDWSTMAELISTLGKLAVKNEFCDIIVSGLEIVMDLLKATTHDVELARQCLGFLRAVGGNDDCKERISNNGGVGAILEIVRLHGQNSTVVEQALAALAALTLRSPNTCAMFAAFEGPSTIVAAMRALPNEAGVQRQACFLLRNLVSRNKDLIPVILEAGAESVIKRAREQHAAQCDEVGKAALRDLGCQVKLEEPWKGIPEHLRPMVAEVDAPIVANVL
eukprot:Colp12_sorted_trinity150504_noHs@29166